MMKTATNGKTLEGKDGYLFLINDPNSCHNITIGNLRTILMAQHSVKLLIIITILLKKMEQNNIIL